MELIQELIDWTNINSGFVSVVIFFATLLVAWASGLLTSIRKKPKFKIELIESDSFGCIFDLGREYKGYPVNKTSFAIYLRITNTGNAPSSIGKIRLGYMKSDLESDRIAKKLKNRVWIKETFSKDDFRVLFEGSDRGKIIPFLRQRNGGESNSTDTYLLEGKSVNGMTYFEQVEAYGNWMPRISEGSSLTNVIIEIKDAYGGIHRKAFDIDMVDSKHAFRYNAYFGQTQYEYFVSEKTDPTDAGGTVKE